MRVSKGCPLKNVAVVESWRLKRSLNESQCMDCPPKIVAAVKRLRL